MTLFTLADPHGRDFNLNGLKTSIAFEFLKI